MESIVKLALVGEHGRALSRVFWPGGQVLLATDETPDAVCEIPIVEGQAAQVRRVIVEVEPVEQIKPFGLILRGRKIYTRRNVLKIARSYAGLLIFVASVIALDQWTKWLVRENVPYLGAWLPAGLEWLSPYARIVHWYNTGAAFGMFQGYGWVFTILAFVVSGMILFYYPRTEPQDWWLRLAMGMQMSGALGNVIDRLTLDWKVTDFISIGNFPVFNVADASITLGVVVLLVGVWWKELREKREAANATNDTNESTSLGASTSTKEAAD